MGFNQSVYIREGCRVTMGMVRNALACYLNSAGQIVDSNDHFLYVKLHGRPMNAFKDVLEEIHDRVFDVYFTDGSDMRDGYEKYPYVSCITRDVDDYTMAVASGFIDACARQWGVGIVHTDTGRRLA